jgi:hypothetical protein
VRAGAKDVAKGGEQLQENGFGLRLGVRGQGAHGFSGQAIERVLVEYGLAGALGRLLLVERRLRRTREWEFGWDWDWGGQRGDRRGSGVRVSRAG